MSGLLNKHPWPNDRMRECFVVEDLGSTIALKVGDPTVTCYRPDGTTRPSQPGDVLSLQPGGLWQAREPGTAAPYELKVSNGMLRVYCPTGEAKDAAGFVYWDAPNL